MGRTDYKLRRNYRRLLRLLFKLNRPEYFFYQITILQRELGDAESAIDHEIKKQEAEKERQERRRFHKGRVLKIGAVGDLPGDRDPAVCGQGGDDR